MTRSNVQASGTRHADDRPALGKVATNRIASGLRDMYRPVAEPELVQMPSRIRDALDKLLQADPDASGSA